MLANFPFEPCKFCPWHCDLGHAATGNRTRAKRPTSEFFQITSSGKEHFAVDFTDRTPKPPCSSRLQTIPQATTLSFLLFAMLPQKKALMCFSISSMQVFGSKKLEDQNMCEDESVDLMSSTLPAKDSSEDFHPVSLFLILAMIGLQ